MKKVLYRSCGAFFLFSILTNDFMINSMIPHHYHRHNRRRRRRHRHRHRHRRYDASRGATIRMTSRSMNSFTIIVGLL